MLFHATYKVRIQSIEKLGLGAKQIKNYDWSRNNVVCLANDPYLAESFLEAGVVEDAADSVVDSGIVILAIDSKDLDHRLLNGDANMHNDNNGCYEYRGIINTAYLKVWSEDGIIPLLRAKRIKGRPAW